MGKFTACFTVLLAFAGAACRHGEQPKQIAALDSALKAGVITQGEYDAKKAALASLAALDKARDAGLLTPAEYQERKERLNVSAPVPDAGGAGAPTAPVSASTPSSATLPNSSRQEHIFDSHLNLNAYDVTVPANWKFDGIYVPGSSCTQIPFPVFRMYSPDGLTEIRRLPRFDWSWSTSKFKPKQQSDCLDLQQELTAGDFLKYYMAMTQVAYVRDFPIAQQTRDNYQKNFDATNQAMANSAKQMAQLNASLPGMKSAKSEPGTQKGQLAAAIGEYRNGTFTIEEQILVSTRCMHSPINYGPEAGKFSEQCSASVRVARAPKGHLEPLLALSEAQHLGAADNPEWVSKYMDYQMQVAKAFSAKMNADFDARMKAQHQEFERAQAVRSQQHQEFLATMQEGTQRSMARAQDAANSRHAIAQDWCDYVLDRQTVTGPGGTVKISNAYNQTWTDSFGNYYQTNDPNANPNGVLSGNWTQMTQVHGDGTAK
jgi:hypothetical protein